MERRKDNSLTTNMSVDPAENRGTATLNCNLCGGTEFTLGPGKRLSATGRLPQCVNCGSLERHRALREMYLRMKQVLPLQDFDVLQISDDRALPPSWFSSFKVSVYGGQNSIDIQKIALPDEQYHLVACNHVLEHVENDRQSLKELLRIVRKDGLLQLGVPDLVRHAVTDDRGSPRQEDHGRFRISGMDILNKLRETLSDCFLLTIRLADPVTRVEDIYFVFSGSESIIGRLSEAFPGAAIEFLAGDGKQHPLTKAALPLAGSKKIVPQMGRFRSSRSYQDYVLAGEHSKVAGWVTDGALTSIGSLAALQEELGVEGAICEIGVHHGRLFIALASMVSNDALCLAIDVFEDQEANVDKSGHGDYAQFMANVDHWLDEPSRIRVLKGDSLTLTRADLMEQLDGNLVRLFSVDGGHTVKHVVNDISIAEEVLAPGGVAIVDDFFNPHWPGVAEGVFRYLNIGRPGTLAPFAYGDNKLYLTQASYADRFHKFVGGSLRPFAVDYKAVELASQPVHQIRMPAAGALPASQLPATRLETQPPSLLGDVEVLEFTGPWHATEKFGRWTGGENAGVVIEIGASDKPRIVSGRFAGIASQTHPEINLDLYVNGVQLVSKIFRIAGAPLEFTADLSELPPSTKFHVEFKTDHPVSPKQIGLSPDPRTLGVFVIGLRLS